MLGRLKQRMPPNKSGGVDVELRYNMSGIEPIEPSIVEKELGIEALASEDAKAGIPMTEDIFPSQSEADIRRYVSDRVNGFIDWASARIKFSDKVLTKSEIQTTIALDLRNTVQRFEEQELKT